MKVVLVSLGLLFGTLAVSCVSPAKKVEPVSTPTPTPVATATPEPDVPGFKGWTMSNLQFEMGQCVQITKNVDLCACLIGTVASGLTFREFNDAKINQSAELQASMEKLVQRCIAIMPQTI